jgi:hypothetical protein
VDVIEDQAVAVVRKGAAQMVVRKDDTDPPGAFRIAFHAHEEGPDGETPEDEAHSCHAWKVGMLVNPAGAMLSTMFGQAFDTSADEERGFYL